MNDKNFWIVRLFNPHKSFWAIQYDLYHGLKEAKCVEFTRIVLNRRIRT